MEQYISKSAVVAEIKRRIKTNKECMLGLRNLDYYQGKVDALNDTISSIDTLEAKDMSMPALDNGNMPIERWKEACEAASCQANYRKSKGRIETCDDYFVDGVQWADEHPIKMKEVDLDEELESFIEHSKAWVKDNREVEYNNGDSFNHIYDLEKIAKHFFELGLKAQKGE